VNFSKIFEKLVSTNLLSFLAQNSILCPQQFGFRQGFSTSLALLKLRDHILEQNSKNLFTCAIFLDLKKAFDTVDHHILLRKLSYLLPKDNNLYMLMILNQIQDTLPAVSPKVLRLVLSFFLLYIKNLPSVTRFNTLLFANDTTLTLSNGSLRELEKSVNSELTSITAWMQTNKLTINFEKTNFILFGDKSQKHNMNIFCSQQTISQVDSVKYLGILIDSKLTWISHLENLGTKGR